MIRTLRRELLDRILIVNEHHLRRILTAYLLHFNAARPHRTLAQLAPSQTETPPPHGINLAEHQIHRRPILDGLICEYHLAAWDKRRLTFVLTMTTPDDPLITKRPSVH